MESIKVFKKNGEIFELIESTDWYHVGYRFVRPYFNTIDTFCKGRWINRTVFDILCNEFPRIGNDQWVSSNRLLFS